MIQVYKEVAKIIQKIPKQPALPGLGLAGWFICQGPGFAHVLWGSFMCENRLVSGAASFSTTGPPLLGQASLGSFPQWFQVSKYSKRASASVQVISKLLLVSCLLLFQSRLHDSPRFQGEGNKLCLLSGRLCLHRATVWMYSQEECVAIFIVCIFNCKTKVIADRSPFCIVKLRVVLH